MILNKIEDPRSNLDKAHRRELYEFAKAKGITEITDETPAIIARHILRQHGMTRIDIPQRILGAQNQPGTGMKYQNRMQAPGGAPQKGIEADMVADLARQFAAQAADYSSMSINELRNACKERGIKLSRKDNMQTMRDKLANGQDAA